MTGGVYFYFMLFLVVIEWIMESTLAGHRRIQWTLTSHLDDLDFASDLTQMLHTLTDIQKVVVRLAAILLNAGYSINRNKTHVMRINNKGAKEV